MEITKATRSYMVAVILVGTICVSWALSRVPLGSIDIRFLFLACFTLGLGSRISVRIPKLKSHISVSDTFIFLTLLLYGGELAVLLAAAEATVSSWRFCNKKITVFFNSAALSIATTAVYLTLYFAGLDTPDVLHGRSGNIQNFIIALSVIAMVQFGVTTLLATTYESLKNSLPFWETWKKKYIWTFVTYFFGSVGAALLAQISGVLSFAMFIAVVPVIMFVFLTYRMYLSNVEMSLDQAEQAEKYARTLESQASALRDSEGRFRSAFDNAPIGIALVAPDGTWLKVNRALTEILGYQEDELVQTNYKSVIFPEDLGLTMMKIGEVFSGVSASSQMEHRYLHKNGRTVWASWSVSAAGESVSGNPNLIFQMQDITDKKEAEERLHHDATHDALTGLANRALFMRQLASALRKTQSRPGYNVSILFIDLDRFKNINDSLGHLFGDRLLVAISERLRECLRPTDMVARLGGDEFVILVEGEYDPSEVVRIAERVQLKFGIPFALKGHEVYSSASIGILHASEKHETAEDMMRDADTAMYQAKRAGKARHEVFDEQMHTNVKEMLRLETDLRRAVENDDLFVYYQPIFTLATREIEGFEALVRWVHPELGEIPPDRFVSLAEEIGLIDLLGEKVLRQSCLEFSRIQSAIPERPLFLSVNLSCRQFANPHLAEQIRSILSETKLPPTKLRLEITESVLFEYQTTAIEMLNALRKMGISLNIDDFGTGYSNLSYLATLPISNLKIDRSFISAFEGSGTNPAILQAIVTLARNLNLGVVAEGVETALQCTELEKLGCESAQGYFFARPMDLVESIAFVLSGAQAGSEPLVENFVDFPVHQTVQ
jgi:diguanylate cyclase (GGDEF)-like protein/PAS domain S-box-containing protein